MPYMPIDQTRGDDTIRRKPEHSAETGPTPARERWVADDPWATASPQPGLYYDIFETPFGWMGMLASRKGLRKTTLPLSSLEGCVERLGGEVGEATLAPERFDGLKEKLGRYFQGQPVDFDDEPIDVDDAPPFHRAAWEACRSIPRGETRSYMWLAIETGRPKATRAAGQSMARNRLPIVVPCHRVVASDGGLGGFGKGESKLDLKRWLLKLEAESA